MTDQIGGVEIEILSVFRLNRRVISLSGDLSTESNRTELEELFRDSESGGMGHIIPGGPPLVEDYTDDERYIQFCIFDSDRIKDGWYLLQGFQKGEDVTSLYPYTVKLFFYGTMADVKPGFAITDVDEISNDWGI